MSNQEKKEFKIRKVPIQSVLKILYEMKARGLEFADIYCTLTPAKDFVHIEDYFPSPGELPQTTTTTTTRGLTDKDINDLI